MCLSTQGVLVVHAGLQSSVPQSLLTFCLASFLPLVRLEGTVVPDHTGRTLGGAGASVLPGGVHQAGSVVCLQYLEGSLVASELSQKTVAARRSSASLCPRLMPVAILKQGRPLCGKAVWCATGMATQRLTPSVSHVASAAIVGRCHKLRSQAAIECHCQSHVRSTTAAQKLLSPRA